MGTCGVREQPARKAYGQLVGDPQDRKVYAIAIAILGLAFVVAVAGACWVVADHAELDQSPEVWALPAVIGGAFIGALIPSTGKNAGWLAVIAVVAIVVTAFAQAEILWVIGAALGGVFLGLLIPCPVQRER